MDHEWDGSIGILTACYAAGFLLRTDDNFERRTVAGDCEQAK